MWESVCVSFVVHSDLSLQNYTKNTKDRLKTLKRHKNAGDGLPYSGLVRCGSDCFA